MERLLARLERRFGSVAIPNLATYLVVGAAIVWVLSLSKPDYTERLALSLDAVRQGQVWRLITFIFIPPPSHPVFLLINLAFVWWAGSNVEQHWGTFRFNLYVLAGIVAAIGAAALSGGYLVGNWLVGADASLVLALATLAPNLQLYLYFVPVRAKWLGFAAAALLAYSFATGDADTRAGDAAVAVVYLVFFAGHWLRAIGERRLVDKQRRRRAAFEAKSPPAIGQRSCALCGANEADGADIRVCSCEKCGGKPRHLCLQHARAH
ncbi:MAG: rhomboid family intramembrane serine protease [Polyangiaceae bacterium]|nr:rhomboid family intramembrane serine protease [Polyangiaceae bacterium]